MPMAMCPDCSQVVQYDHECKPISKEERDERMRQTAQTLSHEEWHRLWGDDAKIPPPPADHDKATDGLTFFERMRAEMNFSYDQRLDRELMRRIHQEMIEVSDPFNRVISRLASAKPFGVVINEKTGAMNMIEPLASVGAVIDDLIHQVEDLRSIAMRAVLNRYGVQVPPEVKL